LAATEEQLRVIVRLFDAFARLDAEEFAGHLTEDVVFRPSAFVTGQGEFLGREAVRQNLAELREQQKQAENVVRLRPMALYVDLDDEDKILALARFTVIRPTSDSFDTDVAHLHTMRGEQVAELRTWLDHAEGLGQLSRPEEVPFPA
jgi:ketosteroid isomerase-like protein